MAQIRDEKVKEQLRNWMIDTRLRLEVEWKKGNSQGKEAGLQEVEKVHVVDAKWDDDAEDDVLLLWVKEDKSRRSIPIREVFELFYTGSLDDEFNDCITRCKLIGEEE